MKASALPALTLLVGAMLTPCVAQTVPPAGPPAGPADAVPAPSPEQAKLLERQVQGWLTQITHGAFALPDPAVLFKSDGGSYDIALPLAPLGAVDPPDAAVTARAHQLDATRWAIESEQFPPMLKVTTRQRFPDPVDPDAPDGPKTGPKARAGGTHLETVTYEVKFGSQTTTGVFDPSYSTPTNTQSTIASIDIVQVGGPAASISHIGPATSINSSTPTTDGPAGEKRMDMLLDTTMQNYETKSEATAGGVAITLTMDRVHIGTALTGLAHAKLATLIGLAMDNLKRTQAKPIAAAPTPPAPKPGAKPNGTAGAKPGTPDTADDAGRVQARALLVAANGLLTGAKLDESADGVTFDVDGHVGTLTHVDISFAGDAPQDALIASMGLTLDGLVLAGLPPTLAGYVPSHFAIHPNVSNISVSALTKLGMDATAPGQRPPEADYAALFQHGGINLGFDTLGLDIGDAKFTGMGAFNLAGPQTISGQAEITAHGLDTLITKTQADPMLAQAVPVLIFLKGIAKTDADQSVWQVSVANGRALVNGVDLMAMMSGAK